MFLENRISQGKSNTVGGLVAEFLVEHRQLARPFPSLSSSVTPSFSPLAFMTSVQHNAPRKRYVHAGRLESWGSAVSADSSFSGDGGHMTAASVGDSDAVKPSHQSDIPQSSDLSRSSRQHSFMWLSFDSNVKCHWGPMTLLAYSKSRSRHGFGFPTLGGSAFAAQRRFSCPSSESIPDFIPAFTGLSSGSHAQRKVGRYNGDACFHSFPIRSTWKV